MWWAAMWECSFIPMLGITILSYQASVWLHSESRTHSTADLQYTRVVLTHKTVSCQKKNETKHTMWSKCNLWQEPIRDGLIIYFDDFCAVTGPQSHPSLLTCDWMFLPNQTNPFVLCVFLLLFLFPTHLFTFISLIISLWLDPAYPPSLHTSSSYSSSSSLGSRLLLLSQGLQQESHGCPLQTNALQLVLQLVLQAA